MKNKINIGVPALALASCFLLSSCHDPDYFYGNVGVGYSNGGGYGGYGGYSNGIYDSYGFPIFGYMGGRPVYGYSPYGAAIFNFTYISNKCYVPSWGPAPYYKGPHKYPSGIHRVNNLPHQSKGWKQPSFDKGRPSIVNRPQQQPNRNMGNNMQPRQDNRPGGSNFVNVPGRNTNSRPNAQIPSNNRPNAQIPSNNRPGAQIPSNNRPNAQIPSNNRPSGNSGSMNRPSQPSSPGFSQPSRQDRPSMQSGGGRPSFGSENRSQPSRPSFGSGSSSARPSSPSPSARPERPSGGRSSMEQSRPSHSGGGERPSPGNRGGRSGPEVV